MDNKGDRVDMTDANGHWTLALGYIAAGLGVGVAVGIFLAPKAGKDTRLWIAKKCLDAVDGANDKLRHSRMHLGEILERGHKRISDTVATGRQSLTYEPDTIRH